MPTYHVTVKLVFTQSCNAANEENAKEIVKGTFKDQYDLDLQDEEIVEVEEQ